MDEYLWAEESFFSRLTDLFHIWTIGALGHNLSSTPGHAQLASLVILQKSTLWKWAPSSNRVQGEERTQILAKLHYHEAEFLDGTQGEVLKVHKIENFFGSEFYTISLLVMLKY